MLYERFKLVYILEKNTIEIKLVGNEFYKRYGAYGYFIFKNKVYKLKEYFETTNLDIDKLEIKIIFHRLINDKSNMFEDCQSLYSVSHSKIKKDRDINRIINNNNNNNNKILQNNTLFDKVTIDLSNNSNCIEPSKNNIECNDYDVISMDENLFDILVGEINSNITDKSFYDDKSEDGNSIISLKSSEFSGNTTINDCHKNLDSKEIKLENIFKNCTSLEYVYELEIFDFQYLTNIYGVFNNC